MKTTTLAIGCVVLATLLPAAAFSRGGGGGGMHSHSSPTTGGAAGTSPAAPGTNSLGTALSSSGTGGASKKGVELGTGDPAVEQEDRKAEKMISSICRGC
jgi:hypothetical protein